ncbi:MAG TPA: ribonuclease E inhibitor RraB [Bacteroidota bacterium]
MATNKKRSRGSTARKKASKEQLREDPAQAVVKADKHVLGLLAKLGSNVNELHEVSFWMYFAAEERAYKAAAELSKQGFTVDVSPPHDGHEKWLCVAFQYVVPRFPTLEKYRKRLTALAERNGGEFEGWEIEVKDK